MKRLTATLCALALAVFGVATAQDVYEYPEFGAYDYGLYGGELGGVDQIENYDEAAVGYAYGNVAVVTTGPQGAAIDVVITGPDGYSNTFESNTGETVDVVEVPVGTVSIAATDDGLEMAHALVNVQQGQRQTVNFDMTEAQPVGEVGEEFALEQGYFGVEEELGADYEPYGDITATGWEAYENETQGAVIVTIEGYDEQGNVIGYDELGAEVVGHLVGPDDNREEFTGQQTELLDLPTGRYALAATAPGHQVVQSFVQVQAGQRAVLNVRLKPLQDGQGMTQDQAGGMAQAAAGATGLFGAWNADADESLNMQEFEQGFFDVLSGDDEELTQEEFTQGFETLGLSDQYTFGNFDANGNDVVTQQEFVEAHDANVFNQWDQDGNDNLTQEEFERGWFGIVDANGDATVQQDEYGAFSGWFANDFSAFEGGEDGIGQDEWLGF